MEFLKIFKYINHCQKKKKQQKQKQNKEEYFAFVHWLSGVQALVGIQS